MKNIKATILIILLFVYFFIFLNGCTFFNQGEKSEKSIRKKSTNSSLSKRLKKVKYWTYLLQNVEDEDNIKAIINSHYDMVVIDNVQTVYDLTDVDMEEIVLNLKNSPNSQDGKKLVLAYIDIGEAEDYRWYWQDDWEVGDPDFIFKEDPDGWSGNYPVKYWDEEWQDIIIFDSDSYLNQILEDDFDGIYLDWIEAFEDDDIIFSAEEEDLDPDEEMIFFIEEIANYSRSEKPGFLVIAQNALELGVYDEYLEIIDAVAQEQIWFDGQADANDTKAEGDFPMPEQGDYSTSYYLEKLEPFQEAGLPIFTVDYALKKENADKAYREANKRGFIPYVSMRSLSKLSENPPPDY